jgi:hypothetical protein
MIARIDMALWPEYPLQPKGANVVADAMSCKFVPPTADWLDADFKQMGISYCFVGVANVETKFVLESSIPDIVREVQQGDRLLQQVREHSRR